MDQAGPLNAPAMAGALLAGPGRPTIDGGLGRAGPGLSDRWGGRSIGDSAVGPSGRPGPLGRTIDLGLLVPWAIRHRLGLILGLGIVARLIRCGHDRPYWMDEAALVAGVKALRPGGFFGPLGFNQLAPPGFLVAEWLALHLFGDWRVAFRLVPLAAGIGSLFLFLGVARRCLAPGAVPAALALFACSDDLIYYSSEAKQYSSDVVCALACTWLGLTVGSRPITAARALIWGAAGSAVAWCSHPSVFVLAAVGTVGLAAEVRSAGWRSIGLWVAVGLAWAASLAAVHAVAMAQLEQKRGMWAFWAFAFPPWPPRTLWDASWPARRLILMLVEPLSFGMPLGPRLSMLPALGCGLLGLVRLWRADRRRFALLASPFAFAMLAAYLRFYPFHGRLVLFLAPTMLLAVASGLDRVGQTRGGGFLHGALVALVVAVPAASAAVRAVAPNDRNFPNPYGDNRDPVIDPLRFPF